MRRVATGWALFLAAVVPAFGQDKPAAGLSPADLDKKVSAAIYETVKEGVELYNGGNFEGCKRVYQGSLMTLAILLDYRPTTAAAIKEALTKAKGQTTTDAAFTLRKALDAAQTDVTPPKPDNPKPVPDAPKTVTPEKKP